MRFFAAAVIIAGLWWNSASALEETGPATPPLFAGKPLSHWLDEAARDQTPEQRAPTVAALALAVEHEDPATKVAAADALAQLGPHAIPAMSSLLKQLAHLQPWVRVSVMAALSSMGKEAVPALVQRMQQESGGVPSRLAGVLGAIGPDAAAAIPALEQAMQKAAGPVKDQYYGALSQIAPEKYPARQSRRRMVSEAEFRDSDTVAATPGDWPQFHGPLRDSYCRETGLLPSWPEGGPKLLWELRGLGMGYSTVSIAGNRLLTMGDRSSDDGSKRQFALAYDLVTRQQLWATPIGPPHEEGGPRCTPTIESDAVYALGTEADLVCLDLETGRLRWQRNLVKDFGGAMMSGWKFSESPLVDGEKVICTPGAKDAALVALDKHSGQIIWTCTPGDLGPKGLDGAAYASAVVAEIDGVRQYIQLMGRGLIGVDAATGKLLWSYNDIANTTANIPSPVVRGNYVFTTTGYNVGSALLRISRHGDQFQAEEVYALAGREFQNHHGGVVLVDEHVYGGHGQGRGDLTCVSLRTGEIAWKQRAPAFGSASVIYADGNLVFRYDRGDVYLVQASPAECRVLGHFTPPTDAGPAWPIRSSIGASCTCGMATCCSATTCGRMRQSEPCVEGASNRKRGRQKNLDGRA